jgi:hypothetical protein
LIAIKGGRTMIEKQVKYSEELYFVKGFVSINTELYLFDIFIFIPLTLPSLLSELPTIPGFKIFRIK